MERFDLVSEGMSDPPIEIENSNGEWVRFEDIEKMLSGWDGYAWKDGAYIDNIQEYFDSIKENE